MTTLSDVYSQLTGEILQELQQADSLPNACAAQALATLIEGCEANPQSLLDQIKQLTDVLQSKSLTLTERFKIPAHDEAPSTTDTRELLAELHDLVRDAHQQLGPVVQSAHPELGSRLEKYASMQLPKPSMLQNLATLNLQRWDVMNNTSPAVEGEPGYTLNIQLDRFGGQLYVSLAPVGATTPEETENLPQLLAIFEVNNGLPCAHVSSDLYGDSCISLFGTPEARLAARPGDGPVDYQDRQFLPKVEDVIAAAAQATSRKEIAPERMR